MLREKLRNKKGFTLIEIIVVIVILAVLMAVAVPSVMSYLNEGDKARYEAQARAVYIRVQTEYAKAYADADDKTQAQAISLSIPKSKFDDVNVEGITYTVSNNNISAVAAKITINDAPKYVKVEANKKVSVADTEYKLDGTVAKVTLED